MKNMENKQEIRKRIKEKRNAIPEEIREKKDYAVLNQILDAHWFRDAVNILVYSSIQSEVDLSGFCYQAWQWGSPGTRLFFPKVCGDLIEFYHVQAPYKLTPGAFSVLEPDTEKYDFISFDSDIFSAEKSVILVPGIAFSTDGYRIGYGRGYYDRFLAAHQTLYSVGIAYTEQLLEKIPAETHDYQLDEIITDKEYIICKTGG